MSFLFHTKLFQFVGELARVAAPGGTIIIVTWCHRDLRPDEESLQPWEKNLLKKICDSFYLPAWCSTADYVRLLETMSLQVVNLINIPTNNKKIHDLCYKLRQSLFRIYLGLSKNHLYNV